MVADHGRARRAGGSGGGRRAGGCRRAGGSGCRRGVGGVGGRRDGRGSVAGRGLRGRGLRGGRRLEARDERDALVLRTAI